MRSFKKLGVLAAVFALCAIGAANAYATNGAFTASATGSLTGKATANQVFTTNGGTVTCSTAKTSGTIAATSSPEQHVSVKYENCTAFGFATVHISEATYLFTAKKTVSGVQVPAQVHMKKPVTITVTGGIFGECTVTVPEQTVGTVDFENESASSVVVNPTVSGIKYTSTGGVCGSSGENGTYVGKSTVERVGGGTVQVD